MELILLPVSLGEAMDKLTILEIKIQKISDSRRTDCEKEYELLSEQLDPYRKKFSYYYRMLKEINLRLWEIQDRFHGRNVSPDEGAAMCRMILEENDRRFRVKAKINVASGSVLREQKGYREKTAFVNAPRVLDILEALNGAVRYLSTSYDRVVVACRSEDETTLRLMYEDDPSVEILGVPESAGTNPLDQLPNPFDTRSDLAIYTCGLDATGLGSPDFHDSLYDELNIPREVRTQYFHAPSGAALSALPGQGGD